MSSASSRITFFRKLTFLREASTKATVNEGTATRLRYKYELQNDIAGKTGTTPDNKDGWFVGITPELVCVTWVGADDHRIGFRNTGIGQGANSALPIFTLQTQRRIISQSDISASF